MPKPDSLQGSLDLLVLKILSRRPRLHGYAIMSAIKDWSGDVLRAEEGSLYPALHRMEEAGWIRAQWITKDTGRRARIYELTAARQKAARRGRIALASSDFRRESGAEDRLICRSGHALANALRADRLSREIDEELQSHIAEAIEQGRDPAEARRAFGSALRRREESRDIRLLPWLDSLRADAVYGWRQLMKRKADFRRGRLLAGPGHRRLHIGIPAHRRAAAAASAGCASGAPLRSLPSGNRPRGQTAVFRRLRVSALPPDARRGEGSGGADGGLLRRAHGFDLRVGPGDGERQSAICFRVDVRLARTPARPGAAVHGKRRSGAGRASLRRALVRLLGAALRTRPESNRAHIPDGQRPLSDCGRRRGGLHRHRARHRDRHFRSHDDELPRESYGLDLDPDVRAIEAGSGRRTRAREAAGSPASVPGREGQGIHGNVPAENGQLPQPDAGVGARGRRRLRHAERIPRFAGGPGSAGGAGVADCVRQRGQPDDGPSRGEGARDGAPRLDRRGTMAAGATGSGGERLARVPCDRDRRGVRVVVRAVRGQPDQSAGQPGAIISSGGLARTGVRPGAGRRRDAAVRNGARASRLGRQAGERAQRRRGPALAPPPDACADRRTGGLLLSRDFCGRPVCGHVRPVVQPAHRLFGRADSDPRYRRARGSAAGFLGPGRRAPARGAGRRDGRAGRLGAHERELPQQPHLHQRRAAHRDPDLLSQRLAGLDRRHEDSPPGWQGLPPRRHVSRRGDRQRGLCQSIFPRRRPRRKVVLIREEPG